MWVKRYLQLPIRRIYLSWTTWWHFFEVLIVMCWYSDKLLVFENLRSCDKFFRNHNETLEFCDLPLNYQYRCYIYVLNVLPNYTLLNICRKSFICAQETIHFCLVVVIITVCQFFDILDLLKTKSAAYYTATKWTWLVAASSLSAINWWSNTTGLFI